MVTYAARWSETTDPLSAFAPRTPADGVPGPLVALLGRTRAAVLEFVARHPGCTTGELADGLHVGPSGASQHATILRAAGLITTLRQRNTALHTPTAAALALLNSAS
ncbi:winged helix-turn-helix domain-containing protein [Kitasatospora sp. NPDC002227]|uniref:winged helix-turn-helix domain-containing protein n=1 Tax=Kitasatospora sp. NPDC002227 TaxID=3154773 RepID=UPI0033283187